jgi:hypothetical protein
MFKAQIDSHIAAKLLLPMVALAGLLSASASFAEELESAPSQMSPQSSATQIYQQRTADGAIVLTDRPQAGAITQRTWQTVPEDVAAGRQRREQARLEALAVDQRIQRQIDAEVERDHELTLARLRLADAQARRDAERALAYGQAQSVGVYFPVFVHRPIHRPSHDPLPGQPRPRAPRPAGFRGTFGAIR